jgi:hypothetical protein
MTLSPEVYAIAEAQAAKDRELLASLVARDGQLRWGDRTGWLKPGRARTPERASVITGGRVNLAIRPKRKR